MTLETFWNWLYFFYWICWFLNIKMTDNRCSNSTCMWSTERLSSVSACVFRLSQKQRRNIVFSTVIVNYSTRPRLVWAYTFNGVSKNLHSADTATTPCTVYIIAVIIVILHYIIVIIIYGPNVHLMSL